jgi:hypothetical protein
MLRSLLRVAPEAHLLVVGMDSKVRQLIAEDSEVGGRVEVVELSDLEASFPSLQAVRPHRTWREYCWTLTPFLIGFAQQHAAGIDLAVYVDADLFFFESPERFLAEIGDDRHVGLTSHDYAPQYDQSDVAGQFCVQFLPVRTTTEGRQFLEWWRDLCIESCSEKATAEVFGDQKYLDRAPELFGSSIFVESGRNLFFGPWNAIDFTSHMNPIAFHFHGFRRLSSTLFLRSAEYRLGLAKNLYALYEGELMKVLASNSVLSVPKMRPSLWQTFVWARAGFPRTRLRLEVST